MFLLQKRQFCWETGSRHASYQYNRYDTMFKAILNIVFLLDNKQFYIESVWDMISTGQFTERKTYQFNGYQLLRQFWTLYFYRRNKFCCEKNGQRLISIGHVTER